jgi:hypothetical protein
VKAEFRLHRDAKPDFVKGFMAQWQGYLEMLQEQQRQIMAGNLDMAGAHLSPEEQRGMSEEQKQQLSKLKDTAREA